MAISRHSRLNGQLWFDTGVLAKGRHRSSFATAERGIEGLDHHGRCEFCVTQKPVLLGLEREQQSPTIDERHSSVVAGLQAENSHA
jgi:hypothetical protein